MASSDLRQLAVLLVAFVVSLLAIEPLSAAGKELWDPVAPGLLWQLFSLAPTPGLDAPVVFVAGVLSAWLALFLVDGTKRVQAVLVLVAVASQFVPFLRNEEVILPAIASTPLAYGLGVLIGLVAGVAANGLYEIPRLQGAGRGEYLKRWIQFPAATGGLLYSTVALVLVTGVDYAILTPQPSARVTRAGASVVLVAAAFVFFRFDYQQRVAVVSPPDTDVRKYHPYIVGGTYNSIKNLRGSRVAREISGDLLEARTARNFDALNSEFTHQVTSFGFAASVFDRYDIPSSLQWVLDALFLRPVVVESQGWTTSDLSDDIDPGQDELAPRLKRRLTNMLRAVVPVWVRRRRADRRGDVLNQLDQVGVILLAAPTLRENEDRPAGIGTHRELLARYVHDPQTDVVLVLTQARNAGWNAPNSGVNKAEATGRLGLEAGTGGDVPIKDIVLVDRWPELYGFTPRELNPEVDEDRGLLLRLY